MSQPADLSTSFCGLVFDSPFILAASPCTDDLEMVRRAFQAGWAGAVLKTTSVEETTVDLAYPMIVGLEHEGRRVFGLGNIDLISQHHVDEIEERVRALKEEFPQKVVVTSMMAATKEDWIGVARRLSAAGADIIECSFSCPQGTLGAKPGFMLGQDPGLVREVTAWVKEGAGSTPVVIKITPQVADIVEVAQAARDGGADGICASNTIPALMGLDLETFVPYPQVAGKSTYSGLSGPAIKPITLRVIAEISRSVQISITGTGGAADWRDAAEFMLVGARTVQFCTAPMHYGFRIIEDLKDGLERYLRHKGMRSAEELVGKSLPFITGHGDLSREKKVISRIRSELCVKDDLCYLACRDGGHQAIELDENRLPQMDEEKCVGCGLCLAVCPVPGCLYMEEVLATDNGKSG
ncbi:NAD-dependent dihydropyrimidine dehydrogenase subunit PreA [bacterium]|nr:NAD-dependent dihydropyrimidine dehydrogenase subunit PreA [bacterium]